MQYFPAFKVKLCNPAANTYVQCTINPTYSYFIAEFPWSNLKLSHDQHGAHVCLTNQRH